MTKLRNSIFLVLASLALFATDAAQRGTARPPAPSLARPVSTEKRPDPEGFMQRWLILEPIPVTGQLTDRPVQATIKKEYFPNQLAHIPQDGETVVVHGTNYTWRAVDTKEYNVNLYHFAYALDKPTSYVLFWAVTIVNCPEDMTGVRLAVGSNAACRVGKRPGSHRHLRGSPDGR